MKAIKRTAADGVAWWVAWDEKEHGYAKRSPLSFGKWKHRKEAIAAIANADLTIPRPSVSRAEKEKNHEKDKHFAENFDPRHL